MATKGPADMLLDSIVTVIEADVDKPKSYWFAKGIATLGALTRAIVADDMMVDIEKMAFADEQAVLTVNLLLETIAAFPDEVIAIAFEYASHRPEPDEETVAMISRLINACKIAGWELK